MDLEYSQDKPSALRIMWETMEEMNEIYPHLRFGWCGFIIIVIGGDG